MGKNISYETHKFNLLAIASLVVFFALLSYAFLKDGTFAASDAMLTLGATPQTVNVGQAFTLVATENPGTNVNIRAVDMFIQFDPAVLRLDSIENNTTNFPSEMENSIPPATSAGTAIFGTAKPGGAALVGAKDVATLHFTALAEGNSAVTFTSGTAVWDSGVNVTAPNGLTGASITVGSAPHETYTNTDFGFLAANWLDTVAGGREVGNVNGDTIVNSRDLGIMMHYWAQ
jgi:hypothetical protein